MTTSAKDLTAAIKEHEPQRKAPYGLYLTVDIYKRFSAKFPSPSRAIEALMLAALSEEDQDKPKSKK